ncbi:MAG: flagellar FlbD family protein [Demequina sp.]|uniref:flagellar FlbD family protein n=1 Tax=Demequina sp. TaxID=2050685 RepID=UPI003A863CE2
MITLTRFHGDRFSVNPDMIVRADATPDTVITLIDGTKLIVAESLDELNAIVLMHRSSIVAQAIDIAGTDDDTALATVIGLPSLHSRQVTPEAD